MVRKNKIDLSGFLSTFGQKIIEPEFIGASDGIKPQTVASLDSSARPCRFGANEHLLFNLDAAFRVFDVSNKSANLFFTALLKRGERNEKDLCFCQPDEAAYKSCLNLCAAIESGGNLQTAFDGFVAAYTLGIGLGDWVQNLPVWQASVFDDETEVDYSVGNAIQTAIFCGYWSAKNPDTRHEIKRA